MEISAECKVKLVVFCGIYRIPTILILSEKQELKWVISL
jgi:hypothetical protein